MNNIISSKRLKAIIIWLILSVVRLFVFYEIPILDWVWGFHIPADCVKWIIGFSLIDEFKPVIVMIFLFAVSVILILISLVVLKWCKMFEYLILIDKVCSLFFKVMIFILLDMSNVYLVVLSSSFIEILIAFIIFFNKRELSKKIKNSRILKNFIS